MALQQGVFNVTDPAWGVLPTNSAGTNTGALNFLVSQLLSSGGPTGGNGGTIQFPSVGKYKFNGPININSGPASLIFMGTGEGTLAVPLLQMTGTTGSDFFVINNSSSTDPDENIGGIIFQDLQIAYDTTVTLGAAIRVSNDSASGAGSQNVRIQRVSFVECPQGVVFQNTLQGLVEQCTFTFNDQTAGVAITVDTAQPPMASTACNEILIKKCDIRDLKPNSCIAVAVYACVHLSLENVSIGGLNQGILLNPTSTAMNDTQLVTIYDCNVGTYLAGLQLVPKSSAGSDLREVRVVSSSFTQTTGATYTEGGIFINLPLGGDNSAVDTVKLIGVTSQGWVGPGLQIVGGKNIQVIGGSYSGNGTSSAGIAISGSPTNINIVGADLSPKYGGGATAQRDALSVGGSPTFVRVKACTMLDYSGIPVQVTGSPDLEIVDCAGYNDLGFVLTPSMPGAPPSGVFMNTSAWTNAPNGWFGPIAFYVWGGTTGYITIDKIQTTLASGGFTLAPGESAQVAVGGGALFLAVGK